MLPGRLGYKWQISVGSRVVQCAGEEFELKASEGEMKGVFAFSFFPPAVRRGLGLGSRSFSRSFISFAALLVNVTPRMRSGAIPFLMSFAIRNVITRVLPVPAPARTRSGPESVFTASYWGAFKPDMGPIAAGLADRKSDPKVGSRS